MNVTIRVTATGPLAAGSVPEYVREGLEAAVWELIEMADTRLALEARPRPAGVYKSYDEGGTSTGHYRRNMSTHREGLMAFLSDNGMIYGSWLEGIGSRNATTRFKGYSMFRRAAQMLEEIAPGVAQRQIGTAMRRANGAV